MNIHDTPNIASITSISTPPIIEWILPNQVSAYAIHSSNHEFVALELHVLAGQYTEAKSLAASMTARMLSKGTKQKTSTQWAEAFDFLGAEIDINARMNYAVIKVSCLHKYIVQILELLHELLTEPVFPEEELNLEIRKSIQKHAVNTKKTSFWASKRFNQALFGATHPYGFIPDEHSYKSVTRTDIDAHYRTHYRMHNKNFLLLGGNIDEQVVKAIDQYIGTIANATINPMNKHTFSPSEELLHTQTVEDSIQSSIRMGMTTATKQDVHYRDLSFLTLILGGYFGARLMMNIREDKGYTYGIYAYLHSLTDIGYFCISTEVDNKYVEATLKEIRTEIHRLKNEWVSDDELEMVKNYALGQLMRKVDGPLHTIKALRDQFIFGQSIQEEINQSVQYIRHVTKEKVLESANRYLDVDKMYTIIAGK